MNGDESKGLLTGILIGVVIAIVAVVTMPEPVVEDPITCMDLLKEQVALQRCEARYNCTLYPSDYRYGIELADLKEEMNCERKAIESPKERLGDIQAGTG